MNEIEKDRKVEVESCSGGELVIKGGGRSGCSQACRLCGRGGDKSGRERLEESWPEDGPASEDGRFDMSSESKARVADLQCSRGQIKRVEHS
jgi:hypothetical protein